MPMPMQMPMPMPMPMSMSMPPAKKMRPTPAMGYEVYGPDNPNTPAFVDFSRLKEATVMNYLERYGVPVALDATLDEKRVQASRHFHLISSADLVVKPPGDNNTNSKQQLLQQQQNSIERFHAHLQKLKNSGAKHLRLVQQHRQHQPAVPVAAPTVAKATGKPSQKPSAAGLSSSATAEAGSTDYSVVADVSPPMCNRDPEQGYCLLSCNFNGSPKAGGTMIACDGNGHKEQWFHLSCVGLDDEPTGEWFCFTCANLRERELARKTKKSSSSASSTDKGGGAAGGGGGSSAASSGGAGASCEDDGYPRPSSKKLQRYVGYIKNALLAIGKKSGRAEATAKDITQVVGKLYADKLDTKLENDSRKTVAWKSNVAKVLRSTKTPFEKHRRSGQCYYRLAAGTRNGGGGGGIGGGGGGSGSDNDS
jgi:hypothetical protein